MRIREGNFDGKVCTLSFTEGKSADFTLKVH